MMRLLICLGLSPLLVVTARPAAAAKLGVLGDSLSDEYSEESYGSYAENWVEQLVVHGGVDAGPTAAEDGQAGGTWGDDRRSGYEYNWALAGDDSFDLIGDGKHTGLAALMPTEGIDSAVLAIGANDQFGSDNAYANVYFSNWSAAQKQTFIDSRMANIETAVDTILTAGGKLVLVNVPDYGVAPIIRANFSDPAKRELVADFIAEWNLEMKALEVSRGLDVAYVDLFGVSRTTFGSHTSPNATVKIGDVDIQLMQTDTAAGGNPKAAFVHDGIHPNTTIQGVMANVVAEALNLLAGAALYPQFTEAEILDHRGIAYGGQDTLGALGVYSDFVSNSLLGDMDCDGDSDLDDVDPFVLGLTNSAGYEAAYGIPAWVKGDINQDGILDLDDVDDYVSLLTGGSAAAQAPVPEPASLALFLLGALLVLSPARRI